MESRYERLCDAITSDPQTESFFKDWISKLDSASSAYKSDQSDIKCFQLLTGLIRLIQAPLTEESQHAVNKAKETLLQRDLISQKEYLFAYVFNLALEIPLLDTSSGRTLLVFAADDRIDTALSQIKTLALKCGLVKDLSTTAVNKLFQILICCDYGNMTGFDPLTSIDKIRATITQAFPGQKRYAYDGHALSNPEYRDYLRSITQLNKSTSSKSLSSDMKDSLRGLQAEADCLYLNQDADKAAMDACSAMLNEMLPFVQGLEAITKAQKKNPQAPPNQQEISQLLRQAENINLKIDTLAQTAPKSFNWGKIIKVALATLLIGLLVYIIPSLVYYKTDSSFIRSPIVAQARAFAKKVDDEIEALPPESAGPAPSHAPPSSPD